MSDNKNSEPACYSCHVGTDKEGLSLLEFLCERFRYKNSQEWAKLIQTEAVQLNQKKSNPKQLLRSGDKVSYFVSVTREPKVIKKIPIVYEDADILVVNKPPQLPVHPGGKYLNNTLINLLKNKKRNPLILCHRLDRETSGLCVLAKSQRAKDSLYWQFFENKVQKTYWALVWGIPAKNSGKIDIPIGESSRDKNSPAYSQIRNKMMARGVKAKKSLTYYELKGTRFVDGDLRPPPWPSLEGPQDNFSSAKDETAIKIPISTIICEPKTGRTNQIRVHLAHLGMGIVGDKLYDPDESIFIKITEQKPTLETDPGPAGPKLSRDLKRRLLLPSQALHARKLSFQHPRNQKKLHFECPPPKNWKGLLFHS